jgi:DNA polymerase III epsilon subunit-like protein
MSARAVPYEVPAIKRNNVSGWKQPAGSCASANRSGISHTNRVQKTAMFCRVCTVKLFCFLQTSKFYHRRPEVPFGYIASDLLEPRFRDKGKA